MHRNVLSTVTKIPQQGKHLLFVEEEADNLALQDVSLQRCVFVRLGMKRARFTKCRFTQSVFEDCYLREAEFRNVDLTGSFFKDCNLLKAKLDGCTLRYMRFRRCLLNYDQILNNLPSEAVYPDLRQQTLESLIQNASDMGDRKTADKLILHLIEAKKRDFRNRIWVNTGYYRDQSKRLEDRISAFLHWASLRIEDLAWGHGLRIRKVVYTAAFLILLFAVVSWGVGLQYVRPNQANPSPLSFFEALYVSAVTFGLGIGEYTPTSILSQIVSVLERLVGVVYLGFLVAAVYRRIAP